jgi:hypothetical protein
MEVLSQAVLNDFAALLSVRFSRNVFTTEDSIRYTLYASLLRSGISPDRIIVEHRHPAIPGAEVDTVILDAAGNLAAAIEFKYNRPIPSGRNLPLPQAAGNLFRDIFRLAAFKNVAFRYFVYLTSRELAQYLSNSARGLDCFFDLPEGKEIALDEAVFKNCPQTFHRQMERRTDNVKLRSLISKPCPGENFLRVYRIESVAQTAAGV